jgi:hypothetical protein
LGTSTCLNLAEMRRTLEQRVAQLRTSEAPASHPKPEEPLTACAAPLPEAAPGEEALPQAAPEVGRDTSPDTAGDTNTTTGRDTVAEKQKCEDPFPPAPVQGTVWWKAARSQGGGQ